MSFQKVFLAMLKQFITDERDTETKVDLDTEEWEKLWILANEHHVLPIIYESVRQTESFWRNSEENKIAWKKNCIYQVAVQTQRTDGFLGFYRELSKEGINPLVVKGIVCRELYAKPDYRISGDEDLLIKEAEFSAVDCFLRKHGFIPVKEPGNAVPPELGYQHPQKRLYFEIHTQLMAENSEAYGHLNREFDRVWENRKNVMIQGVPISTLSDTEHLLYLVCHSLKHFLHGGFGIRQVMDIVMMMHVCGANIEWEYFDRRIRALKLDCFWENILDIALRYLGLSFDKASYEHIFCTKVDSKPLLKDILDSGVYGENTSERMHSANMTLRAAGRSGNGSLDGVRKSLFPSAEYMKTRYTYIRKYRWLLPAAWVQRIFAYAAERNSKGQEESAYQMGKRRIELMKKYGLTER